MPSGRKDIYGRPSRRLADPKVIKAEMGAERNAAAAARLAGRKPDAAKITAREGTTSAAGGRPAAKVAMPKPVQKPVQVTRTTTAYRPTPMGKKK
jgi:hypothetical protein